MHIHQVLFGGCLHICEIHASIYSTLDHPNSLSPSPALRPQNQKINLAEPAWLNRRFSQDDEIRVLGCGEGVDFVVLEM
jgi:hypothetical protein